MQSRLSNLPRLEAAIACNSSQSKPQQDGILEFVEKHRAARMCLTSTLVGYRVLQSDKVSIQVHPVSARTQQLNFSAKIQGIKIWEGREEKRWPSARVLASAQTNTVPQIWWLINVSSYSHVIQLFIFLFIYLFTYLLFSPLKRFQSNSVPSLQISTKPTLPQSLSVPGLPNLRHRHRAPFQRRLV